MDKLISELLENSIYLSKVGDKLNVEFNGDSIATDLLDKIKSNKDRLLSYLGEERTNKTYQNIALAKKTSSYELSSSQQRIWVLCQFDEVSKVYNMPNNIYLTGSYDIENFKKAIAATIERHEILRTIFKADENGAVKQWVLNKEDLGFEIDFQDYRNAENQEETFKTYINNDSFKPFDLEKGPLLRAALLQVTEDEYVFYYNMHHIISDGWSMDILAKDVFAYYEAFIEGKEPVLTDLRIQYKDYSAWQLAQLNDESLEVHKRYWVDRLSGELPLLNLPSTKERPKLKTNNGHGFTTYIDADTTEKIKKYSLENGGSLFMGLLAVWNILKYSYSAQKDIIIGTVVAGRDHAELENQIGYYLNTLALRNEINPNESFDQFFSNLKRNTLDAFAHQMYPYDRLVSDLDVKRDESRSPIFDVIIALQNTSKETKFELKEEDIDQINEHENVLEKFDMTVLFKEVGNYLSFDLYYNSDVYDRGLMKSLMIHFKQLLKTLLANPAEKINAINFLSESEKQELILNRNETKINYPLNQTVLDLFKQQAKQAPNAIATEFEGKKMTYAELDKKSDELALCLIDQYDIQPNDLVGVLISRSEWLIVSVMGILKAGGVYVPVDSDYPMERQQFIIADINPKVLLILSENMFDILEFDIEAFSVDIQLSDWVSENKESEIKLSQVNANQMAYVIYTSGSTGKPKGVEVTHDNLLNYLNWSKNTYLNNQEQTGDFGLYSSLSFDLTMSSLFLPLISGKKLHIYPASADVSEVLLDYFSAASSSDVIKLTPSHIQLLSHLAHGQINMQTVIVGGEELLPIHVNILKGLNPNIRIFNEYGPTECTIGSTVAEIKEANEITIGKPIANTQVYILNESGNLQPNRIAGELGIGGKGVAKGYLNQSDLTNERFVMASFLQDGDARIYKTGDLARWLPNGNLEYLGRSDDQVKIRGHRIELAEIVNKINSSEFIEESIVLVNEEEEDNKTLAAYFVPDANLGYTIRKSLGHQQEGLPDRMNLHELPNGMSMYAYNKTELHFVYEEIFEHHVYLKHGITIPDNACVFDVGANDGMFSLYANLAASNVKVFAFEPLPPTYALLKFNTELYQGDYKIHNYGLSNKVESASFSYFPNATVLSTRYQETNEVEAIVKKFIKNANESEELADKELDSLLDNRLISEQFECQLRTLSQVIAEEKIEKIDLLKIDVEKSELDVLEGIIEEDWAKIDQMVVEVHDDANDRLSYVKGLLVEHGYDVTVYQSDDAQGTNLYDLYARKLSLIESSEGIVDQQGIREIETVGLAHIEKILKKNLVDQLPAYMVPNHFVALQKFPLTKNGKIDKNNLPDLEGVRAQKEVVYVAPKNELEEKLVKVWEEVLQRENIGLKDDFFALGGHSLKAIRLINEYQKKFEVKLSINELFVKTSLESHVELIVLSSKTDFIQIPALSPTEVENGLQKGYPVSDAQRRLWVLSRFEGSSIAYNISGTAYLNKDIEISSFKKAIAAVIERHEILRTVFREINVTEDDETEIRQWVLTQEDLGFEIDYQDCRNEPDEVQTYLEEYVAKPFDLTNGPLLRVALAQIKADEYIFIYNMHHIISDGWSMETLTRDIFDYYDAFKENRKAELKKLRIQYKDYSVWQLAQLKDENFNTQRAYWLTNLAGKLPLINLPRTKQRPRINTSNGATLGTYLNKELSGKLKAYSQQQGGTLFMGLLATLNTLIYKYTAQHDLIIGSPIAGREHADLENQIGFYVNTLALRNKVNADESFDAFFSKVKSNTLDAYSHQIYPFDRLVDELDLPRDTSRNAVFDVMLVLQNNGENTVDFDPTSIGLNTDDIFEKKGNTSKFDLLINVEEHGDYLSLLFEYNTDVYDREMIEGFIKHYKSLMEALIDQSQVPLAKIDFLSHEERENLMISFNQTKVDYGDQSILDLFEEQVAKNPDKIALVFNEKTVTYKELNVRSNSLAQVLNDKLQDSNTSKVGVMLTRSLESVIAMVGILKAGACYVPIEYKFPTERVNYIIQDANLKVIISEEDLFKKHSIQESTLVTIKKLESENDSISNYQKINRVADEVAVFYTSGSTGKPKGVIQTSRMLRNLIQWDINDSGIEPGLKHFQYASFSFDACLHDVYFILCSSGCVHIAEEASLLDYPSILNYIISNEIEMLFMPFSALNAFCLAAEIDEIEKHNLKYIISTAEQLHVNKRLNKFLENNPKVELHNHYGPSETHVVTSYKMSAGQGNIENRASIGKPISNSAIYILDEYQNIVPQGVTGELYIGGENLAAGYLNSESITQEKFIDSPFGSGKLYQTGDLGYWRIDGNIEYVGRQDDQVKIRGYRIELGEIRHALLQINEIQEAVIVNRKNTDLENEIIAYIKAKSEQNITNIRASLKTILPEYMLPAFYIQLEEFPLTANGKIDKKSLPNPEGLGLASGVEYIGPRNEIEEKLVAIWERILEREKIGIKDDFFALGGHSLKVIKMINRINKEFGFNYDLPKVYIEPTIELIAEKIKTDNWFKEPSVGDDEDYTTIKI